MFYLVLHTALLILAAFVLGAIIGCLLKRFVSGGSVYSTNTAGKQRSTPAQSAAAAAAATVAARAKSLEQSAEHAVDEAVHKVEEVVETLSADAPTMERQVAAPADMDDDAAEAALAALPADASNEDKANAVGTRPAGLTGPTGGAKDNLQRIKGIGKVNEGKLNDLGIFHFSQIRDWKPAEARWVGTFLSFSGRIEREDWIDQAKTLADDS